MIADVQHTTIFDVVASLWVPVMITAGASIYIARLTYRIGKRVDTGNARDLGTTVHDMAQTLEVLSAQVHTNTNETLEARVKAEEAVERVNDWIVESTHVHAQLLTGIAQIKEASK